MSCCVSDFCKAAQRTRLFFFFLPALSGLNFSLPSFLLVLIILSSLPPSFVLCSWTCVRDDFHFFSPSVHSSSAVVSTVLSSKSLTVSKHKWTGTSDKHSHTVWSIKATHSRLTTNLLFLSFIAFDYKRPCVSVCVCIYPVCECVYESTDDFVSSIHVNVNLQMLFHYR